MASDLVGGDNAGSNCRTILTLVALVSEIKEV